MVEAELLSLDKAHLPVVTLGGGHNLVCKTATWPMMRQRAEKKECELWGQRGLDEGQTLEK